MKKNKLYLTLPLATTFILMVLVVIYTAVLFYRISVAYIYEGGNDKVSSLSVDLENYLDTTKGVLWVTADTVDFMVDHGVSTDTILDYLIIETVRHKSQFDANYTGLYGYISGEYLDGLEWVPPDDYDPTTRDWYRMTVEQGGLVIVPPYIDAQTGEMVISVCKRLNNPADVAAIDLYTTHIQEIIESTNINGMGYAFIVDNSGTVIAHKDSSLNGSDYHTFSGGDVFMEKLAGQTSSRFETKIDGKQHTVFTDTIMDQWHVVIAVGNDELFHDVYKQLAVTIATNTIVFVLLALFYAIAYRKQQKSSREAEALKISEQQKEYEAELLKLEKSAADSANKAKGDFLAQMSHEIRTPINAVLGMNEMILRESEDESILDYSRNIQTAGKTLLSLINSILDFSKIEDGKMEIIPARYDTVSLINNLKHSVSERAKSKGLAFAVHADPELPAMLVGDDVRITQVIVNLLTNAVKYTEQGSVTLDIGCTERTEQEITLTVAVRDTGIGIREEDMEKLFESFSRLDETRNRNIEGTGLGMAIVTKLLALMHSELKVESVYGEGSVFSFALRQEIADSRPIGTELERRADPAHRKSAEYPHFPGARILVTDDNDMNLKVAKNLFKLFGIEPDLASSGAETIGLMRKNVYRLVFLDHMMPKMDGIETLAALREHDLIPDSTAVIALTANAVIGAKEKYLDAGFDDYLSKPINLEALEEKLLKYLARNADKASAPAGTAKEPEEASDVMVFAPDDADAVMEFSPEAESTAEKGGDRDVLDQLAAAGFAVQSGLTYCAGDSGFYLDMLRDYAASSEKRLQDLDNAKRTEDWKLYQTLVHALKSNARTVGADDVSELARQLEEAAKRSDADDICAHHGELAGMLSDSASALRTILHPDTEN